MKNAIDFLIDISDKMDKKLTITQTILQNEIIPYLNFDENIGMRTFLSVVKDPIVINSLDMGLNTKSDFMQKAGSLPFPNGGSPIGYTIKESLKSLRNVDADCKRIVLVTAGEETDGGNYEYEIEHGHEGVQVNIIGIGINESDKKIAERASAFTGGVFCEIPEEIFNNSIEIANQLKPLIDALQGKTVAPAQPKEEPKEEVKIKPKAEIKEEPKVEVKPEPKKEYVRVEIKDTPKVEVAAPIAEQEESEEDTFDAMAALKAGTQKISQLLEENEKILSRTLENGKENISKIEKLRAQCKAYEKNIKDLQAESENKSAQIAALKEEREELNATISEINKEKEIQTKKIEELIQQDKDVVIQLDSKEQNSVSEKSEKYLYEYLQKKYPNRVKWMNESGKKSAGYDFEIVDFENNVTEYYIACKGSKESNRTFFLTEKEWDKCLENNLNYQVYLVQNIENKPTITLIENLIGWMMSGKIRPGATKNEKVKAGQIMLSLKK